MKRIACALGCLVASCSWPDYGYNVTTLACTGDMLVCSDFEQEPVDLPATIQGYGWSVSVAGDAGLESVAEQYRENRVLRFQTTGSEAPPAPVVELSRAIATQSKAGRLLFEFRLAELGPYTRLVLAEVDLEERALRFLLRSQPRRELVLQYTLRDREVVQWEHEVPDQAFFQQSRHIEIWYELAGPNPWLQIVVEGEAQEPDALDSGWSASPPRLRFGSFDMQVPTSGADFTLDNLGFDDQLPKASAP